MKIVQSTPAVEGSSFSLHEQRRRHDALVRKVHHAREAGVVEAKLTAGDKSKVANAASHMVNAYMSGRVTRQQIEEEQRADETRLKGWKVAPPQPGTVFAEEPDAIRYRMAVRERALTEIASLDLAVMTSLSDRDREAPPKTKPSKPWTKGSALGGSRAKTGGPISLHEAKRAALQEYDSGGAPSVAR